MIFVIIYEYMIDVRTPHAHDVYFVHDTVRKNIKRNTRYDMILK